MTGPCRKRFVAVIAKHYDMQRKEPTRMISGCAIRTPALPVIEQSSLFDGTATGFASGIKLTSRASNMSRLLGEQK